jgi:hypothetical protein
MPHLRLRAPKETPIAYLSHGCQTRTNSTLLDTLDSRPSTAVSPLMSIIATILPLIANRTSSPNGAIHEVKSRQKNFANLRLCPVHAP